MRFETKSLQEKRLTLRRLHRFLNDMVFNNELDEDIIIDIQDINEYKDEGDIYNDAICGIRPRHKDHSIPLEDLYKLDNSEIEIATAILFDVKFIEDVGKLKTQKMQILLLARIMLHEMVHQYCRANGIDDKSDHDDQWYEIARQHGLEHGVDDDGTEWEDIERVRASWLYMYFRLR